MTRSEAVAIIRERVTKRCREMGTEYREHTMTDAVVDVFTDLLIAFADEVQGVENRVQRLEHRAHDEDNYALEQRERN